MHGLIVLYRNPYRERAEPANYLFNPPTHSLAHSPSARERGSSSKHISENRERERERGDKTVAGSFPFVP